MKENKRDISIWGLCFLLSVGRISQWRWEPSLGVEVTRAVHNSASSSLLPWYWGQAASFILQQLSWGCACGGRKWEEREKGTRRKEKYLWWGNSPVTWAPSSRRDFESVRWRLVFLQRVKVLSACFAFLAFPSPSVWKQTCHLSFCWLFCAVLSFFGKTPGYAWEGKKIFFLTNQPCVVE